MKLLIITQKVDKNDGVLSFMLGWIKEFAKQCEHVTVIALYVGEHDLPPNVRVLSLGKESGASRLKYLWNFFFHIFRERHSYDAVFVHMNQIYVILGGLLWRLMGKRIALWYAHGSVPWNLRVATCFTDVVIASTPSGFRLKTKKLRIVGQGINTDQFSPVVRVHAKGDPIKLLIVGRISPAKDYETLLRATKKLIDDGYYLVLDVVGGAGTPEQEGYFLEIKKLAQDLELSSVVTFHGSKPHEETVRFFHAAHIFVSTATNGSFDKAMGDAMATGLPLVACNEAMSEVLGGLKTRLMFPMHDVDQLVAQLIPILDMTQKERDELGESLRTIIERDHGLKNFITKILSCY